MQIPRPHLLPTCCAGNFVGGASDPWTPIGSAACSGSRSPELEKRTVLAAPSTCAGAAPPPWPAGIRVMVGVMAVVEAKVGQ